MRRAVSTPVAVVAAAAVIGLGLAVSALGSASSSARPATTGETTEQPSPSRFRAALSSTAEVPRPVGVRATAGGKFSVALEHSGSRYAVTWKLTFHNLSGKAIAAHIHRGKPGKAGPVLLTLCRPCRSGQSGKGSLSAAAAEAVKSGSAYAHVHTPKNRAGEIRGQIRNA
jgi:hypothetical protein